MQCGSSVGVTTIPGGVPHLDGTDIRKDRKKNEARGRKRAGRIRQGQGNTDIEVPSFIDNMRIDIINWEGGCDM